MVAAAMLATGCTQDDTLTAAGDGSAVITPDPDKGIVISGSGANGIGATRGYVAPDDAASGPQVDGICRADVIDVLIFKENRYYASSWPDNYGANLKYEKTVQITGDDVNVIGNDRFASCTEHISQEKPTSGSGARIDTYVLSRALAYSKSDRDNNLFSVTPSTASNIPLTLNKNNGYKTPELFYGILHGNNDNNQLESHRDLAEEFPDGCYFQDKDNGIDIYFTGRIFRIVGQLNLNITEIPGEAVEKIELWGDNYPTSINLNGDHGEFYPVAWADTHTGEYTEPLKAATDEEQQDEWTESGKFVLLDSKELAEDDDETTLSTFLLPSKAGMHLRMRVYYRMGGDVTDDTEGTGETGGADTQAEQTEDKASTNYKDFEIRPESSVSLGEKTTAIYKGGVTDANGNYYVYNNSQGEMCFYSYANVRVTMSGKFEHVAGETSTVDVNIEVDPGFVHGPYVGGSDEGIHGGFDEEHEITLD